MGWTARPFDQLNGASGVEAGGFGVRYFMARAFGLYAGLDFAWSPDEFVRYIVTGSAWN